MKLCPTCNEGAKDKAKSCDACGAALDPSTYRPGHEMTSMVIEQKYALREFIEEGGMGWIYRAEHLSIGRDVAIKLMKPTGGESRHRTARFEREARSASRLSSPHIISVLDFGRTPGGLFYLVTEYVRGITLGQEMDANGPMTWPRILRIFAQIFAALDEAHARHVVHRDLKPENIMLTQFREGEDFIKILDFGIATVDQPSEPRLTKVGQVCGTPAYMAPEQISGKQVTSQADIYACGVILYELLCGVVPLEGDTIEKTMIAHLRQEPPPLRHLVKDDRVPDDIDNVISKAMAIKLDKRYRNVSEFRDALFQSATRGSWPAVPCTSCHRSPDSPNGFCSDHCVRGDRPDTYYEDMVVEVASSDDHKFKPVVMPEARLEADLPLGLVLPGEDGVIDLAGDRLHRQREHLAIRSFMEGGDHQLLEIIGPPGTGKTTLLEEVLERAGKLERSLLATGQDPSLARSPWFGAQQLVRQALGLPDGPVPLGLLRRRVRQARLLPDDVVPLALLLRPPDPDRRSETALLIREVTAASLRLLLAINDGRSCVVVDDAGQLDGASLRFVRNLCAEAVGTDLKVVVASDRSLLDKDCDRSTIYLGPVGSEEVRMLLLARGDHTGDLGDLEQALSRNSSGLLLYVDQALRHMDEGGDDLTVPLEVMVQRRLEGVPRGARKLLEQVCVIGLRAAGHQVHALGLEQAAAQHRDVLIKGGWLRADARGDLVVAHPYLQETILQALPAEQRRALHRRVLELVEGKPELVHVAARHAFEAGAGRVSLELQERAGDIAVSLADLDSAANIHYRRALDVGRWELRLKDDDPQLLEIKRKAGHALRMSGHLIAAEVMLEEALAGANGQGALRANLLLELARLDTARCRLDDANARVTEGLKAAILVGDRDLMIELYLELAELLEALERREQAVSELNEGILLVTGGGTPEVNAEILGLWRLLHRLGTLQDRLDRVHEAVITAHQAVLQARGEGSLRGEATCLLWLGRLLMEQDERDDAREHMARAAELFRRLGDRQSSARCLMLQAELAPDHRDRLLKEASDLAEQVRWHDGVKKAQSLRA